jgi:endonuclease V-like protein UPF0215 family
MNKLNSIRAEIKIINELKKMKSLRTAQIGLRQSLKEREEKNKALRAKITPLWADKTKDVEFRDLSIELVNGRKIVRATQIALRELKHGIRVSNKIYDRACRKASEKENA